jgi:hypothetical protein
MLIAMQRSGQRMVQYFQASVLQMVQRCKHANNWLAKSIHTSLNALCIYILLAKTKLSTKHLVANLIIQVQLIKAGLIHVLHKVGDLGQQLLTTAHRIRQRVKQAFQQGV